MEQKYVLEICAFIQRKFDEDHLRETFPNRLLRGDVLTLLDRYCTVLFYPLEDEENNGFHITGIPSATREDRHLVFINTAQTIEKQIFTAAHELGHIWNVDSHIQREFNVSIDEQMSENVINRFAAELLLPAEEFRVSYEIELKNNSDANGQITVAGMLKVIVALMNQFLAPEKAVIYRCEELKCFGPETARILLGEANIPKKIIKGKIREIFRDNGYTQFLAPNNHKWIDGLPELLEEAAKLRVVSKEKIQKMRNLFDIQDEVPIEEHMNDIMP